MVTQLWVFEIQDSRNLMKNNRIIPVSGSIKNLMMMLPLLFTLHPYTTFFMKIYGERGLVTMVANSANHHDNSGNCSFKYSITL